MTYRRLVLLAVGVGVLVATGLGLINLVSGPATCVSQPICKQSAAGEAGCLPVPESCSGLVVSIQTLTTVSIGAALFLAVFLVVRRRPR